MRPLGHVAALSSALLLVFLAGAGFFPLASGPDEPAHYIHAASVVRGQWADLTPTVPAAIDNLRALAACLAFDPGVTAACQQDVVVADPTAAVVSDTPAGYYNPVFYLWTGLASLVDTHATGLYGARVLAAVVTATVYGWAVSFFLRDIGSRWASAAVLLLTTPLVLYIGSVLNPSAWEIAATFGVIVSAWSILVRQARVATRWSEAHNLFVAASCVMIVSRGMSPVFFVILVLCIALAAGWTRMKAALASRQVWLAAVPAMVVGLASVLWIAVHGTNYVGIERPSSLIDGIRSIPVFYQSAAGQVQMMYGALGWLDVTPPDMLIISWIGAVVSYVWIAFAATRGSSRWALGIAAATCILLPGIVAGVQWSGLDWQGRYTLPLVVGVISLAALGSDVRFARAGSRSDALESRLQSTTLVAVPVLFAVGLVWMIALAARRYLTGVGAGWGAEPTWLPPLPLPILGIAVVVGVVVFCWFVVRGPAAAPARESGPVEGP